MCSSFQGLSLRTLALLAITAALLVGCTSSKDVSKTQPFASYVGRTVVLNRPVALIKEGRGTWAPAHFPRLRSSPFVMLDFQSPAVRGFEFRQLYPADTNYITIAVGTSVTLESVRDEVVADTQNLVAYGSLILPDTTNTVRFAYSWGHYWQLRPAPWEPPSTPEIRRPPGKLPPHWDYDMFYPAPDAPTWGGRVDSNK
jgi:hypothetical protein